MGGWWVCVGGVGGGEPKELEWEDREIERGGGGEEEEGRDGKGETMTSRGGWALTHADRDCHEPWPLFEPVSAQGPASGFPSFHHSTINCCAGLFRNESIYTFYCIYTHC